MNVTNVFNAYGDQREIPECCSLTKDAARLLDLLLDLETSLLSLNNHLFGLPEGDGRPLSTSSAPAPIRSASENVEAAHAVAERIGNLLKQSLKRA